MKYSVALAALVLSIFGAAPASAADPSFACNARAPQACHFRIFYTPRGDARDRARWQCPHRSEIDGR